MTEESDATVWLQTMLNAADYIQDNVYDMQARSVHLIPENPDSIWSTDDVTKLRGKHPKRTASLYVDKIHKSGFTISSCQNLGHVPVGGHRLAALAELLGATLYSRKNMDHWDEAVVHWTIQRVLQLPVKQWAGMITSGSHAAALEAFINVRDKFQGHQASSMCVYITEMTHSFVELILRVVGLGDVTLRILPCDSNGRMNASTLKETILQDEQKGLTPFLTVASLGTTDIGSVDPVASIAAVTSQHGCWLHVDAAIGGYFMLCEQLETTREGLLMADSINLSMHKSLFVANIAAICLIRRPQLVSSSPLPRQVGLVSHTESQTQGRGFAIWFVNQLMGTEYLRDLLTEKLILAQYIYEHLRLIPGLAVSTPPDLCIVAFYVDKGSEAASNEATAGLLQALREDGRVILSGTVINGLSFIRMCTCNARLHRREVDNSLKIVRTYLKECDVIVPPWRVPDVKGLSHLKQVEDQWKQLETIAAGPVTRAVYDFIKYVFFGENSRGVSPHNHLLSNENIHTSATDKEFMVEKGPRDVMLRLQEILEKVKVHAGDAIKPGRRTMASIIGQYLTSTSALHASYYKGNPGVVTLERHMLEELRQKVALPVGARGLLCYDVTVSLILTLLVVREKAALQETTRGNGKTRNRKLLCYCDREMALLVQTALIVVGLKSTSSIRLLPQDLGQLSTYSTQNDDMAVFLIASDESVDHVMERAAKVTSFGHVIHVHVHLSSAPDLTSGIKRTSPSDDVVDSISADFQRGLALHRPCVAALFRDSELLRTTLEVAMPYVNNPLSPTIQTYNPADYSFELCRPCRSVSLWMALNAE